MDQPVKISIDNLTKVFYKKNNSVTAIQNITLNVEEGEFVCIVGPSGCGKTTFYEYLARLEQPSSGTFQ